MTQIAALADTHTAIWYLLEDPKLSAAARSTISNAALAGAKIAIASISLVEMVYLADKGRLPMFAYEELREALVSPTHVFTEVVLDAQVAQAMRRISREDVPDMPDRIIAASALHLGVPVISRDRHIRSQNLATIW